MNSKRIDFTKLGGFGLTQDALDFSQTGNHRGFEALARAYGNKIIVAGVDDQGATLSDGYVVIAGELMPFVGGAKAPAVWLEDVADTELFGDSSQKEVYYTRRARMGMVGPYQLADFRRWKTDRLDLADSEVVASANAVKTLADVVLATLAFEACVILKGCTVTGVNTVASTLAISAGMVKMGEAIVSTQPYAGAYPVYLGTDGVYNIAQPAGDFILFDPYTSQRYNDVLKRATTPVGEIKTFKTLSDRFDAAGIGRWEMQGFIISDDMQSRVPLGYDRRATDPGNDPAWDAQHHAPGNAGGVKRHTLSVAEMPGHTHSVVARASGANGAGQITDGPGDGQGTTVPTTSTGGGESHENRQPFRVVVFAERV